MRNRLFVTGLILVIAACDSGGLTDGSDREEIPVPDAYSFESRFVDGESSVFYGGQVVRNLLINDLKIRVDDLAKAGATAVTEEDLLHRYDYDDSYDLSTLTLTGSMPAAEARYSAIDAGKDLVGKIDAAPLMGVGLPADEVIRGYFQIIAENSQDPVKRGTPAVYTTEDGVDMSQMINKILLGAVVYSQGTGTYLNGILEQDNTAPEGAAAYTVMEHNWDEAFGYFGAARDFTQYGDADLAGGSLWKDSNGDGAVDFNSEYNFTFVGYAGKRDVGAAGVDFTGDIFQAFLEGRTAITNQSSADRIAEQRDVIVQRWERLVAANVIHYINETVANLAEVSGAQVEAKNNEDLNEHWSEMKGFAYALQFNPLKVISDTDLERLHDLMGDAPTYALPGSEASEAAASALLQARNLLQSTYGFSDTNVQSW